MGAVSFCVDADDNLSRACRAFCSYWRINDVSGEVQAPCGLVALLLLKVIVCYVYY